MNLNLRESFKIDTRSFPEIFLLVWKGGRRVVSCLMEEAIQQRHGNSLRRADSQQENRTMVPHETEYQQPVGLEPSFRENVPASILTSASYDAE